MNQRGARRLSCLPKIGIDNQIAHLLSGWRQVLTQKHRFPGAARRKDGQRCQDARVERAQVSLREFRAREVPQLSQFHGITRNYQ
ncbi:hypothetical protein [Paraburkholderia rhizosphaerae]|uniref:hypothetical protein n=1 Tax=Paraburkholderia rhizosphaerae TaxID=480658 RepID=UPI00106541D8|nr:hypothetical protein [Paraburkholderia rhizosphaerae]